MNTSFVARHSLVAQALKLERTQEHVFAHWDVLASEQRDALLAQLRGIDPGLVNKVGGATRSILSLCRMHARHAHTHTRTWLVCQLFAALKDSNRATHKDDVLPAVPHSRVCDARDEERAAWREAGLQAVREGKLAVVLLAGAHHLCCVRLHVVSLPHILTLLVCACHTAMLVCSLQADRARVWGPLIRRACTTSVCHPTGLCSRCATHTHSCLCLRAPCTDSLLCLRNIASHNSSRQSGCCHCVAWRGRASMVRQRHGTS